MPPFPDELVRTSANEEGAEDAVQRQEDADKEERALEDAICSVVRAGGRKGVGVLVSLHGNTGILTNHAVLSDLESAGLSSATFFPTITSGDAVEVALLPEKMFLSSPLAKLGYAFVACEDPPGVKPFLLRRGRDCGVRLGERVVLKMKGEAGTVHEAETRVVELRSPCILYKAENMDHLAGMPISRAGKPSTLSDQP